MADLSVHKMIDGDETATIKAYTQAGKAFIQNLAGSDIPVKSIQLDIKAVDRIVFKAESENKLDIVVF